MAVVVISDRYSRNKAATMAAETGGRKVTVQEKDYTKAPTYERDMRKIIVQVYW